jgi:pseudouridine-5'-phosphate glycosidase
MTAGSLIVADEVASALAEKRPVVALESTIFSTLGLPSPANAEALARCVAAIRAAGAVPALTAVVDGVARVGLEAGHEQRIHADARKVGARDLPVAIAQRWDFGATTVSASVVLAARAGVAVFATGGIGGVHRGAERTGDISADLGAIAAHPVVTVCAGAKAFLDIPRTLEHLEMLGVPVLGFATDTFPGFWMRSTSILLAHRVDSASEAAAVARAAWDLGYSGGVLVAVPVPETDALPADVVAEAVDEAEAEAARQGITGPAVTPFVLSRVAEATDGRSLPANLALAEQNARVAGAIATELCARV